MSGILVLLELDGRFPPFAGLHHSKKKRAGIRDAFVVENYKKGRTVSMSF